MGYARDILGDYRLTNPMTEEDILAAAGEILRRKLAVGEVLTDPTKAGQMFQMRLAHLDHERFEVAYLSTRHQVIAVETHAIGTLDGAEVHPREIVKAAIKHGAAACILSHNHPSGSSIPSAADKAVSLRLKQALGLVDCRVLDHLIVVADGYTSMAAQGLL